MYKLKYIKNIKFSWKALGLTVLEIALAAYLLIFAYGLPGTPFIEVRQDPAVRVSEGAVFKCGGLSMRRPYYCSFSRYIPHVNESWLFAWVTYGMLNYVSFKMIFSEPVFIIVTVASWLFFLIVYFLNYWVLFRKRAS